MSEYIAMEDEIGQVRIKYSLWIANTHFVYDFIRQMDLL
jgi:hypothetical protein